MSTLLNSRMSPPTLSDYELEWIKAYLYQKTGIVLNDTKRAMVMGRLEKRLRHFELESYDAYFKLFDTVGFELETTLAIDLLTTNETYFFREPKHFDFLETEIFAQHSPSSPIRLWSAASSSGEEAYTLAMVLENHRRIGQWEIVGTDISTRMLAAARRGLYSSQAAEKIPLSLLKKYCLKGSGDYDGFLLIDQQLRNQVKFVHANLLEPLSKLGQFDIIFLRNVMIYFDIKTKQALLSRITHQLKPGGYFFISHSESLSGMQTELKQVKPSIYRKPPAA